MAGPDAHGAQSAEQSITVDSLHSPPNSAGTAGARQGDPGPVHRVIPGGGRHDRPATRPTDRSDSVPHSTGGGGRTPPHRSSHPPRVIDPSPHPVHRDNPGGARHARPATQPTDRTVSPPPPTGGSDSTPSQLSSLPPRVIHPFTPPA